jgi:hypothetical protein
MIQQCEFWSSWVPTLTDKDNNGWTALIDAAETDAIFMCRIASCTRRRRRRLVTNSGEETACHLAAAHGNPASLCALVAAGGDLDQPDN